MNEICECCKHERCVWKVINGDFSECLNCHVYRNHTNLLEERPIPQDIEAPLDVAEIKHCVEKYTPVLLEIEKYHKDLGLETKSLYDIACGCGGLVWLARTRGWVTGGCDINLSHQRNAKEFLGIDIDIDFDKTVFSQRIGCFVFHHGIEHMDKPKETIEKAIDNLVENGIIYFQHPVMPEGTALLTNTGHQYEWTWEAFDNFIKQFYYIDVLWATHGRWDGSSGVPSQTWIVRKK